MLSKPHKRITLVVVTIVGLAAIATLALYFGNNNVRPKTNNDVPVAPKKEHNYAPPPAVASTPADKASVNTLMNPY